MSDIDVSNVDPLRWAEMRRRVAVLQSFADIEEPTTEDRLRHAAMMGVGAEQFRRQFLLWKGGAKPAELDGAGGHKNTFRNRRTGLPPETKAAVAEVIHALGATAALVDVNAEVKRRCAVRQIRAPSRSQVWNMLMATRRAATSPGDEGSAGEGGVAIGTIWFKLPVVARTLARPEALLAVDVRTGTILAADVAIPPARPQLRALLEELDPSRRVQAEEWLAREVDGRVAGDIPPDQLPARRISSLVGDRIGGIGVYRDPAKAVAPARLARLKRDAALVEADAREAIRLAIGRHNAARAQPMRTSPAP